MLVEIDSKPHHLLKRSDVKSKSLTREKHTVCWGVKESGGGLQLERKLTSWPACAVPWYLLVVSRPAKLHFTGTTSWYFNQIVDENINYWHKYQMLMKISKAIDKNVNSWKGDNLTKMSILTEISNLTELSILTEWSILTEMSILTKISILTKRSIWQKGQQYTSTSPTSSHLMI